MNNSRIREIQKETAYPDSISVQQALFKVWNECSAPAQTSAQAPALSPKKIDLSICVNSKVDMEFWLTGTFNHKEIAKLKEYSPTPITTATKRQYDECRVRQDHWHSWNGGTCP